MKRPGRGQDAPTLGHQSHGDSSRTDDEATELRSARQYRGAAALIERKETRERVDRIAEASNGPDAIRQLRRRGLQIMCETRQGSDSDGHLIRLCVYHMLTRSKRLAQRWLTGKVTA